MRNVTLPAIAATLFASPALAAKGPFFSLGNTDFVVLLGFLLFLGVLAYFKVPGLLGGMLDKRAEGIRNDLDEARKLREEAQALLASYERKSREVQDQAGRIVAQAKEEAELAADQARAELQKSIARRLAAAEDQIKSAEASAVKDVRDRAATVAVMAARDVVAAQMTAKDAGKLIDDSIAEVGARLN
ncbi:F0F1 ATP synthase subunit B [Thalassococcus sp. CAU 1522]|uniref:ATP synthase subunit b n=1 Tax=Thalassococcus arenae TaxID=2851652 RepID=A0ABS6N6U3_9RHOB|nr:F0F1 ATP synthase subunit B [Thalassococcus arenae]MBV2359731.1 F0F1 ATP synthase subunit B [Thalassococcus arenae]